VPEAQKAIALTFDDGLEPEIHKKMLDIFKKEKVHVTFFMIGEKVTDKRLIKRTLREGHEIGNHTMSHPVLPLESTEVIDKEIEVFQDLFETHYKYEPKVFRAPKLQYDERVMHVLSKLNLVPINANVGTKDYAEETTNEYIYDMTTNSPKLTDGSIFLMHEVQKTTDVIASIIVYYKQNCFKFLTVSEMLEYQLEKIIL